MKFQPETLRIKARELLGKINSVQSFELLEEIEKLIDRNEKQLMELSLQQDELHQSNQELEEKNRRLDDLFENAPVCYFILNSEGLITEVNDTACRQFKSPKEKLLQKKFSSFIHPLSLENFNQYWSGIVAGKNPGNAEIAMVSDLENPQWFLINSLPFINKRKSRKYIRVSATNISDIKEAEMLRDSERRYRLLFKNMVNGLLVLKPVKKKGELTDFKFFRANAAFESITQLDKNKLESMPVSSLFPDRGVELLNMLQKTYIQKENQKMENIYIGHDTFVNVYSFLPEEGYVAMIIENVTAELLSERHRQKSEELLQTIFKIIPLGVIITNARGYITDCNLAAEELLGIKKEQLLLSYITGNEFRVLRPDMTPMPPHEHAATRALKENRIVENVEMGVVKNDGNVTWINVSAAPIPLPEMGVAVVYLDITERVQAQEETEEKFKNIVQNSTDAITIIGHNGSIIEWNKGCEMIFGYSRKEVLGKKVWEFMRKILVANDPLSKKAMFDFDNIVHALKTGESRWFRRINETAMIGAGGKKKIIQSVAFPVKSAGGYLLGIVARDISESKETENMLKIAKEKAEEASYIKSQFLTNISHEIRTPLNAIMGFTEILKEFPVTDQKFKSLLSGIEKSSKALMALISDILDLSRIEAGKLSIKPSALTITSMVEDVGQIFSLKAEQKGLYFKINIEPNVPQIVCLDEIRLRQILFNLVGNAVKFTRTGGINITVSAVDAADKPDTVDLIIKVIDTGPGISEKDLAAIFDPFFQKRTHKAAKQEGTGLGLSISRRFAEMMNGKITVESEVGKGTEFTVFIPSVPKVEKGKMYTPPVIARAPHPDVSASLLKELIELIAKEFITRFGSVEKANEFMHREIWSEYDKVSDILGFDEVISFTGLLLEISARNNLQYLREFSIRLSREAASYNVIELNKIMASFETLRNFNYKKNEH